MKLLNFDELLFNVQAPAGAKIICAGANNNRQRTSLNFDELVKQRGISLNHENLSDDDLDVLSKVIEQSTVLGSLSLNNNNLTLSDGKLANAFAKNTTLKALHLTGNNFSAKGIKLLADALKKNNTIYTLILYANEIGDEGAKCLADMLADNKTLELIGLGSNNIGDVGAEKLAEGLEFNHSLEFLDLSNNNISNHVMEPGKVTKRIKAILNNSKRKEIAMLKSIAKKDKELEGKDKEIGSLKKESAKKDREIAKISRDNAKKDKQITSLKESLESYKQVTGDLTSKEDDALTNKRTSTNDTSMEIWDKPTPRMMTRRQNQILNRASEKPIVKVENIVMGFKRCPFPGCNTIGLFTKGCSIVTCTMSMRHDGNYHHFCFYCGKSAIDSADSCNNRDCLPRIDEESRKLYQEKLDKASLEKGEEEG